MSKSIEMLGRAGETIITNYCTAAGQKVLVSEDQYDNQKDMIIDGLKVEVKTQVPYIYKNAFSFKPNQLRKCKNADRVIFISVPSKEKPHHSDGKVFLIKSADMKYYPYKTKDGREMIAVPIDQEGMDELFTLTDKQCKLLQSYSVSGWN
jgi:hypothetical protein